MLGMQEHAAKGGKAWDTVKPLSKWFRNLARVILVDDDAYKVVTLRTNQRYAPCSLTFMARA